MRSPSHKKQIPVEARFLFYLGNPPFIIITPTLNPTPYPLLPVRPGVIYKRSHYNECLSLVAIVLTFPTPDYNTRGPVLYGSVDTKKRKKRVLYPVYSANDRGGPK